MAYVLGYIYADGALIDGSYMRGKYLTITSTDQDSIERIKSFLDSEHTIFTRKSNYTNGKLHFGLKIGSHKIYNDLLKFGLFPNKSLTVKFPKIPKKYIGHFIRGYFDGDGCIFFEKGIGRNGQGIIKRIRTIFTSGSKTFLEGMDGALRISGIIKGKIYQSHRAFQSKYPTDDSILIFKLMYSNAGYNSFFMRKFKIFSEYLELRPIYQDSQVKKLLDLYNGHVVKQLTQRSAKSRFAGANPAVASPTKRYMQQILPE